MQLCPSGLPSNVQHLLAPQSWSCNANPTSNEKPQPQHTPTTSSPHCPGCHFTLCRMCRVEKHPRCTTPSRGLFLATAWGRRGEGKTCGWRVVMMTAGCRRLTNQSQMCVCVCVHESGWGAPLWWQCVRGWCCAVLLWQRDGTERLIQLQTDCGRADNSHTERVTHNAERHSQKTQLEDFSFYTISS